MAYVNDSLQTLTIANGQTESNAIVMPSWLSYIMIWAPATLPETVVVQVEPTSGGTSFGDLYSGGANVEVPALKAVPITVVMCRQLRLKASSAVGADRNFTVLLRFSQGVY